MIHSALAVRAPLTDRQASVLDTIQEFIQRHGISPTHRELGALLGITSPNGVSAHLRVLERKGYIEHLPAAARGIRLTEQAEARSPAPNRQDVELFAVLAWLSLLQGAMPTLDELAREVGCSIEELSFRLQRLSDLGCIQCGGEPVRVCVIKPPVLINRTHSIFSSGVLT
jgi:DNA-binding IclR family transcriptional regulator